MPRPFVLPEGVDPIAASYSDRVVPVPDIIEFVVSDKYLNRPNLYPRQATLLKTIFLQDELFTAFDYQVLEEWSQGFSLNLEAVNNDGTLRYQGYHGIQPDILDRIRLNKEAGRKWFRECIVVIGRRGGKGYVGGLCGAYVLWNYLALGDPQGYFGVDRDKKLGCMVFAGKKDQAKSEQYGDIRSVITGSNCFAPYINDDRAEALTIYAPHDALRQEELRKKGIRSTVDIATFLVEPRESTKMSGRGPASFMQYYDEQAHVTTTTARASAEDVYGAATPSLDQFKGWEFIYAGSSPWQMMGQFYENWQQSLQIEAETHEPVYPERLMVQLESWDIYNDWERAHDIKLRKGYKRKFNPLKRAVQTFDTEMERLERANPETFAVERRSRWASSLDAYLNQDKIAQLWLPWPTEQDELTMQTQGKLHVVYMAHVDPSKSGANTGLAVAHIVGPDENGFHHVVFDIIKHWQPGDFEDNQIDYIELEKWWDENVIDAFMPEFFTFDQFDASIIQRTKRYARSKQRPKSIQVWERTAEKKLNWKMAECFKTALGLNLLHAPYYEQADLEMIYLQDLGNERVDHPTSGPVQTKDVWDAMANVTYSLIGAEMMAFLGKEFTDASARPGLQGGIQPLNQQLMAGSGGSTSEAAALFQDFHRGLTMRQREAMARANPARGGGRRGGFGGASPFSRGRG